MRVRPARRRGWIWVLLTVGIVGNGLRLRRRLGRLPVLETNRPPGSGEMVFVTAAGVVVDDRTRGDAIEHARRHDLRVVDLVPGDLHVEQALDLARLVDPATYRRARLTVGRGALHAIAVDASLVDRLALPRTEGLDEVEMVRAAIEAKRCAPTDTDLAVAPFLRSIPMATEHRLPYLRAVFGSLGAGAAWMPAAQYALMLAGLVLSPGWGAASLAASAAQPWLATVGTPVDPANLTLGMGVTRWWRVPIEALRSRRTRWEPAIEVAADPRLFERLVPAYRAELAGGIDRFFEPRRSSCPWCGATDLARRIEMPDLMQHKPGTFRLDRCRGCGHIFQNPRLSIAGLDFYYRDFYDGLAADDAESVFAITDDSYIGRVEMVTRADTKPDRWLDVGAGYGHFCLVAAGDLPHTQFDGLDLSDSIDDATRRGWLAEGFKGRLPELAEELAGTYDVVSMCHYLEHTREPREELAAAWEVLRPGGHLLIELPDPDCALGRLLGQYWGPWFQPQHQHFLSRSNLGRALAEIGFTVVEESAGDAHQPSDLMSSVIQLAERVAPHPAKPWLPKPTTAQRFGRSATLAAFGPPLVTAVIADRALAPLFRRIPHGSNAFRLLARRDG